MGPAGMVLADSGKRLIARLIDFGILILFVVVVQFVAVAALVSTSSSSSSSFGFNGIGFIIGIGLYVVYWLYESLMASSRGQTVGKIIMKIKIVDASGNNPETSAAMKRSLVWLVPLVPCCIGWLAFLGLEIWGIVNIFNTPERRTLFDTFAETWVVDAP